MRAPVCLPSRLTPILSSFWAAAAALRFLLISSYVFFQSCFTFPLHEPSIYPNSFFNIPEGLPGSFFLPPTMSTPQPLPCTVAQGGCASFFSLQLSSIFQFACLCLSYSFSAVCPSHHCFTLFFSMTLPLPLISSITYIYFIPHLMFVSL